MSLFWIAWFGARDNIFDKVIRHHYVQGHYLREWSAVIYPKTLVERMINSVIIRITSWKNDQQW